jgi:hypothetical protein
MTRTIAIARHEIAERWLAWPIALVLGGVPLLALAMLGGADASDDSWLGSIASVGATGLVCASWVAAMGIGVALVGPPLHERRISFYFARPIATGAIAAGKLLGGLVLVSGIEGLLWGPMAAYLGSPRCIPFMLAPALACLGVGLVIGVVARSRSRWLAVDAAGLAVFAGELVWLAHRVGLMHGPTARDAWTSPPVDGHPELSVHIDRIWLGLGTISVIALFIAAAAAVMVGRTDRERAHAALSRVLWPILIAAGAAAGVLRR